MNGVLPELRALAEDGWSGLGALGDQAVLLDPSQIQLATDQNVRAYFVGEQAGYRNSLLFRNGGEWETIFPELQAPENGFGENQVGGSRKWNKPLLPGDFVDLGNISSANPLEFGFGARMQGANGESGGTAFADSFRLTGAGVPAPFPNTVPGAEYMKAFAYTSGDSSFLVVGFEDTMGNGARDFTDAVVAFDISAANLGVTATPEPGTVLTLSSLVALVAGIRRKRQAQSASAA